MGTLPLDVCSFAIETGLPPKTCGGLASMLIPEKSGILRPGGFSLGLGPVLRTAPGVVMHRRYWNVLGLVLGQSVGMLFASLV